MRSELQTLGLAAGLLVLGACASIGAQERGAAKLGDSDLITRIEIDRGQWADSYQLVRQLRPHWVRARGTDSLVNPGEVQVYVDGTRLGAVTLLRTLPTTGIDQLEWIDPVSAAGRWGLDHAHGVISITYTPSREPPQH